MAMCRLTSLLIVAHSVSPVRLVFFSESEFMRFTLTGSHSAAWCSHDQGNTSALVSSCRAAVWTVIRADKLSVWRDSNESRGFVPLLAHKHYIEHLSNSSYRFIVENYFAIIIVIELSPSPTSNRVGWWWIICRSLSTTDKHLIL